MDIEDCQYGVENIKMVFLIHIKYKTFFYNSILFRLVFNLILILIKKRFWISDLSVFSLQMILSHNYWDITHLPPQLSFLKIYFIFLFLFLVRQHFSV